MSESELSNVIESEISATNENGIFDQVKSLLLSKKGLCLIAALVLIAVIYCYTKLSKKSKKVKKEPKNNDDYSDETDVPEPPPGYVTVPVEMLQGLQQEQIFGNSQEEQEVDDIELPSETPKLKHNKIDEEEEIADQNLSKEEMESIQAQLSALQHNSNA